jgi:tol-pal system protein YbgF
VGAFFRQPVNVEVTREQVDKISRQQAELLALTRELNTRLENQSEAIAAMRADNNISLRQLADRIEVLRAQLEDQGVRFERMQRRVEENLTPTPSAMGEGAPPDTATTAAGIMDGIDRSGEGSSAPPGELYDAAYRDVTRGNYQLAITGMQDFLRNYSDHDLADNAQYWIGECHYGLGDLDQAVLEFLKVRDLYPQGDKVAAATLKAAYAFLRKGDGATARRYFDAVVREYPNSNEADLARDKLKSLN